MRWLREMPPALKRFYAVGLLIAVGLAMSGDGCSDSTTDPIAKIRNKDAVDSGGHLDWDARGSKYLRLVPDAAAVWNDYKSGVIRADSATRLQDVGFKDVNLTDKTWGGLTSFTPLGDAKIELNLHQLDKSNVTDNHRKHTIAHELGHALGLDENNTSSSHVMSQGFYTNLVLSADDKASYDAAAARY